MGDEMRDLLGEAIETEFLGLAALTKDEDRMKTEAVERIERLYKLRMAEREQELNRMDDSEKVLLEEREHELEVQKAKDQRWWQYIRLGVDFLGIALPLGFYGIWMKRGFRFEETGSITSQTMRHLIKWFKPTR